MQHRKDLGHPKLQNEDIKVAITDLQSENENRFPLLTLNEHDIACFELAVSY